MSIFKKKTKLLGLEKARQLNLITDFEFLKLKRDRADEEFKKYSVKKTKKKK